MLCVSVCVLAGERSVLSLPSLPQANALEQLGEMACCMANIRFMDLSGNRITSLVGLEGCPGLLELSISENRITRTSKCG